jgi:hypothetical protein
MEDQIVFGERMISVNLPDDTIAAPSGMGTTLKAVEDLDEEIRRALKEPVGLPPLGELVGPGSRVTIAFDDPTVPCYAPVWEKAIGMVIEELERAGVKRGRIGLLCANALHRKFTRGELARLLGEPLVREFGYRLRCHDAEDPEELVFLGRTESGYDVEINRAVVDSDLTVYVNTAVWRGFTGGWKSICVGLSSYRSIRWHHTPEAMSMSLERNPMHEMLDEMGALVEGKVGKERIFKVETVLANPLQVARVLAGGVTETRRAALSLIKAHMPPRRELLEERADILLYGVPDWSPYAAFSRMNPILTLISTALGYLGGVIEAIGRPGCTVILATPCHDQWDERHHPAYREVWEDVLSNTRDPHEIMDLYEEDFAHRPEYIYKYRFCYGFHPVHALMATYPLKRLRHASRIIVAGAQRPQLALHLGFDHAPSVEEAIRMARDEKGRDASLAFVRYPLFLSRR